MSAGDLPPVDLPFFPPANDPPADRDHESDRIVAALRESLRRLQAGQPKLTLRSLRAV